MTALNKYWHKIGHISVFNLSTDFIFLFKNKSFKVLDIIMYTSGNYFELLKILTLH